MCRVLLKLKERWRVLLISQFSHRIGEYAVQRGGLRKKVAGRQLFTFSILRVAWGTSAETVQAQNLRSTLDPVTLNHYCKHLPSCCLSSILLRISLSPLQINTQVRGLPDSRTLFIHLRLLLFFLKKRKCLFTTPYFTHSRRCFFSFSCISFFLFSCTGTQATF